MEFKISNDSSVQITLNEVVKVAVNGDYGYRVEWFYDNEFLGDMYLNGGTWGSMLMPEIGDWVIKLYSENNELVKTYNFELDNSDLLVIFDNDGNSDEEFYTRIKEYALGLTNDLNVNLHVYFKGSELCDFYDTNIKPLRLNDKISKFDMIYNKVI